MFIVSVIFLLSLFLPLFFFFFFFFFSFPFQNSLLPSHFLPLGEYPADVELKSLSEDEIWVGLVVPFFFFSSLFFLSPFSGH